jgi:hypothetical protein
MKNKEQPTQIKQLIKLCYIPVKSIGYFLVIYPLLLLGLLILMCGTYAQSTHNCKIIIGYDSLNTILREPLTGIRFADNGRLWDTYWDLHSVEFEGDTLCQHDFAIEKKSKGLKYGCLVLHDIRGCPDNWDQKIMICRKCLRKVVYHERRELIEVPKSEMEILEEKVQERIKKQNQ